eukprot:6369038-Prymnesium_polylepis.1
MPHWRPQATRACALRIEYPRTATMLTGCAEERSALRRQQMCSDGRASAARVRLHRLRPCRNE